MRIAILLVAVFIGVGLLMGMSAVAILGVAGDLVTQFMWPLAALAGLWLAWRGWRWWWAREKDKQRQAQATPSGITFYINNSSSATANSQGNTTTTNVGR